MMNDYTTRTPGCVTHMQDSLGMRYVADQKADQQVLHLYMIDNQLVDVKRKNYLQNDVSPFI